MLNSIYFKYKNEFDLIYHGLLNFSKAVFANNYSSIDKSLKFLSLFYEKKYIIFLEKIFSLKTELISEIIAEA
jgi:hypothetical protein